MFTYKINVALRGRHFCKIDLVKGIEEATARDDFRNICARFPASDGFSLHLEKHPIPSHETVAYSEGA